MDIQTSNFKCSRLGKPTDRYRQVKIKFSNADETLLVLRSQNKLKQDNTWKELQFASDWTQKQREFMSSLRNELEQRRKEGEDNIIIKYIRDISSIISQKTYKLI